MCLLEFCTSYQKRAVIGSNNALVFRQLRVGRVQFIHIDTTSAERPFSTNLVPFCLSGGRNWDFSLLTKDGKAQDNRV